jgi:hypothetical protein
MLLLLALAGCDVGPADCTMIAVWSVTVHVVDEAGDPVPDAVGTFTVDGGAPADCEALGDGTLACGAEQDGVIAVHVTAPFFQPADVVATVGSDECHVITEDLTVTLTDRPCSDDASPSVIGTVTGSSGEELTGIVVEYAPSGGDDSAPCAVDGDTYACGEEEAGDWVITAVADGHALEAETVTVGRDECGVITVTQDFQLDWLPD